ncbi:hypothetical protein BaRGS_00016392 [Batillaria attramentaria]|uniref:Uncharacterized protein n=1 Tax=Batillaria attramentaria TaxID=370345 RepID=A0ABD0KZM2_9CAEN
MQHLSATGCVTVPVADKSGCTSLDLLQAVISLQVWIAGSGGGGGYPQFALLSKPPTTPHPDTQNPSLYTTQPPSLKPVANHLDVERDVKSNKQATTCHTGAGDSKERRQCGSVRRTFKRETCWKGKGKTKQSFANLMSHQPVLLRGRWVHHSLHGCN